MICTQLNMEVVIWFSLKIFIVHFYRNHVTLIKNIRKKKQYLIKFCVDTFKCFCGYEANPSLSDVNVTSFLKEFEMVAVAAREVTQISYTFLLIILII